MTQKTCLRCDWEGATQEAACPNCGVAPLFVRPSATASVEGPRQSPQRNRDDAEETASLPSRSFRSAVALVVAVLVLLVVVGSLLKHSAEPLEGETAPDQGATASQTSAMPERIAADFLDALGGLDAERAITYLADDADISGLMWPVAADLPGAHATARLITSWFGAEGYRQVLDPCAPDAFAPEERVRCPFGFQALGSYEIGLGPYRGSYVDVTVRGGEIVSAVTRWNLSAFSAQVWEPFARWISRNHPQDVHVMYANSRSIPQVTPMSIRLWERRSRAYIETKAAEVVTVAERFMGARNAFDVEGAMSMLTEDGARVRLMYNNRMMQPEMGSLRLDRHELALALEAEALYGVRYGSVACRSDPGPIGAGEARVECSYLMDSKLRQIAGYPPKEASFVLGVRNDRVASLSFPWLNLSFPANVPAEGWKFRRWLKANHPEAGAPMVPGTIFRTMGQELTLILTRDSLDHLASYLEEYSRSVAS